MRGMTLIETVVMMAVFTVLAMGFVEYQASLQAQSATREMQQDFEMQCALSRFGAKTRARDRCGYFRNVPLSDLSFWIEDFRNQGPGVQALQPFFTSVLPYSPGGLNTLRAGSADLRLADVDYKITTEKYTRPLQLPIRFQTIGAACVLETVIDPKPNDMTVLPRAVLSGCVQGLYKQTQPIEIEVGDTVGSTAIPLLHSASADTRTMTLYHVLETPLDGPLQNQFVKVLKLSDHATIANSTKVPAGHVSITAAYRFIPPSTGRPEYKVCEVGIPLHVENGVILGCGGDAIQKSGQHTEQMCIGMGGEPMGDGRCALPGTDASTVCRNFKGPGAVIDSGKCVSAPPN